MDDLLEFIVDLVLELGQAAAESSKTPKWLRRTLQGLFILLCAAVTLGLMVAGVLLWDQEPIPAAVLFLVGTLFLILGLRKLHRHHQQQEEDAIEPRRPQRKHESPSRQQKETPNPRQNGSR